MPHRGAGPPADRGGHRRCGPRSSTPRAGCSTPACGRRSATGPTRSPGSSRGRRRPAPPSRSSGRSSRRRAARSRSWTCLELGRFCVQGVKRGDFIIGHGLEEAADHAAPAGRRHRGRTAPAGRAELMSADRRPPRPLHRRLRRRPCRRRHPGLPAVPGQPLARRVRRLGGRVREPLRRPHRAHRLPQLGQRPAPGRDRVRRHRGRGAVPQHGPALLRRGQPGRPAADAGGLRAALGRRPGAQPLAGRLLRPARRAGGPASCRSSPTTSTTPWPRCAGPPRPSQPFGGILLPVHPAQLAPAAAVGGPLRAAVAGVRRARRAHQHPRGQRAARLRGARGGAGDDAD